MVNENDKKIDRDNDDKKIDRDNDDKKIGRENDDNTGLPTGAIIGIVIAAIFICIVACYGIYELRKHRESIKEADASGMRKFIKENAFSNEEGWANFEARRFFENKGGFVPQALKDK